MNLFSVIVTYNPSISQLTSLCRTLVDSGSNVIVVDNSEVSNGVAEMAVGGCAVMTLGENTGIAHAQNVGVRTALTRGADVVVFFDQDSKPDSTFLPNLLAQLQLGVPAVVAPVCVDKRTGDEMPSFRLSRLGLPREIVSHGGEVPYAVDLVISSGSAATAVTFAVAGVMDEDFFIDYVDFEWCLRCREKKVPITVVPAAVMRHSIGERSIDFGVMGGVIHGPARSYYKVRNCFLLFRKRAVPFLFALRETLSALVHYVALLPFVKGRRLYLRIFFLAIWHGLTGVIGKNPVALGHATQIRSS